MEKLDIIFRNGEVLNDTDLNEVVEKTNEIVDEMNAGGHDGKSAYEIAVAHGYVGSETDWLASLHGKDGHDGSNGLRGEKGDKGDQGNSGYQGAAGELEVVNNLTDGGATKALSAEMGKRLDGRVYEFEKAESLRGVILKPEDWKCLRLGAGSVILKYSDTTKFNLGEAWTIKAIVKSSEPYESSYIFRKGDEMNNGWALMREKGTPWKFMLYVNGEGHEILASRSDFEPWINVAVVSTAGQINVSFWGKIVASFNNRQTSTPEPLTVGEASRYLCTYLKYFSAIYRAQSDEDILKEFKLLNENMSLNDVIELNFVACPLTMTDYGYRSNGLTLETTSKRTPMASPNASYPLSTLDICDLYDGRYLKKITDSPEYTIQMRYDNASDQTFNNIYWSRRVDVSKWKVITIYNIPAINGENVLFFDENGCLCGSRVGSSLIATSDDSNPYSRRRDVYTFDIPAYAVYAEFMLRYDSYLTFEERGENKYVVPQDLVPRWDVIYRKTPNILFESDQFVAGKGITYWGSNENQHISVTSQNGADLTVDSAKFASAFSVTHIPYNIMYKTADNKEGMLFAFRDSDDNVIHILNDEYPTNIVSISTHTWHGAGGMHLSTACSRFLSKKIIEASNDITAYQLLRKTGYLNSCTKKSSTTRNGTVLCGNVSQYLLDPNGNKVFSAEGSPISSDLANKILGYWGIYSNEVLPNGYRSSNIGEMLRLRQKALYKYGFYEICGVSPRYSYTTKAKVSGKIKVEVYNNGLKVDEYTMCDYMQKSHRTYLDERNTSGFIYNLHEHASGSTYALQTALNAVPSADRSVNMLLGFRNFVDEHIKVFRFCGDRLASFTDRYSWEEVTWGNVDIVFTAMEETSEFFLKRVMQFEQKAKEILAPITNNSYVAWLGDSWTGCDDVGSDPNEPSNTTHEALDNYDYESSNPQPTKNVGACPLPRTLREVTGCKLDLWGKGTKTSKWAWDYQIKELIKHNYTHCVIEFFSNDSSNDNFGEVTAMARMLQNAGITPIIFSATHPVNDGTAGSRPWAGNNYKWVL